jgi:ATP-dependent DNA helicase RecG
VFVVCPAIDAALVEEDAQEPLDLVGGTRAALPRASVTATIEELRKNPLLAGARVEALHGRLPGETKDELMRAFAAGDLDVFVATTVIEVGVDVPNASTMVILDADRFGVSQLHQLRGRVGRGTVPGLCLMVTHAETGMLGRERVEAVAATLDGFELAQADLELRQEGDVLGSAQSGGRSSLKLLRVAKDGELISDARTIAEAVLDVDPQLQNHTTLRDALARRLDDEARDFLDKN